MLLHEFRSVQSTFQSTRFPYLTSSRPLEPRFARILIGDYDRSEMNDPWKQTIGIADYRIHGNYNNRNSQDNIAILKTLDEVLQQRLELGKFAKFAIV